ncbi:esterase-like activity of phytase family protein, partial [Streptomyces sp. NPDC058665]|uniref:esterase-like activity of phytase family protein n=1 Tax=Streptomyces sp. NPDC058665 TaxID=3346586 RepID=UPI00366797A8
MPPKRTCAALVAVAVAAGLLAGTGAASAHQDSRRPVAFDRTATYPVFQNRPDAARQPAVVARSLTVKGTDGRPTGYDAEGIHARKQGGFWLAVEGTTGAGNKLVRLDSAGNTRQVVPLPADVAAGLAGQGFEGVTAT